MQILCASNKYSRPNGLPSFSNFLKRCASTMRCQVCTLGWKQIIGSGSKTHFWSDDRGRHGTLRKLLSGPLNVNESNFTFRGILDPQRSCGTFRKSQCPFQIIIKGLYRKCSQKPTKGHARYLDMKVFPHWKLICEICMFAGLCGRRSKTTG